MSEFEISVNNAYLDMAKVIQPLLTKFEEQNRAHVGLHVYDWSIAWTEFMKISLYHHGPVISQTGNSWMGSMIAQNSLRAFKPEEIAQRGQGSFLEGSWESCLHFDNKHVVAIPWILDTYLVYYHRDMLEKAGIDEASAFSTLENFEATLQKLQDNGQKYPFAVPADATSFNNIHTIASWIWGQGGDFTNPEGTYVTLSQPKARKGMKKYFDLYRFIPPEAKDMNVVESWNLFLDRKIAITVRTPELLFRIKNQEFPATLTSNIGTAVVPGVPLLGGSHLVIWNHLRPEAEEDAIDLVKFLTSAETELTLLDDVGYIPANVRALERIPSDSIYAAAVQSVRKARPFRHIRMWGLVEEKLAAGLSGIWQALLSAQNPDVSQIIADQIDPIEASLNTTLAQ